MAKSESFQEEKYSELDDFIDHVCKRCRYYEVCEEYEFRFGVRLASKVHGVIRCPMFEEAR